jgi:hypothetical protein
VVVWRGHPAEEVEDHRDHDSRLIQISDLLTLTRQASFPNPELSELVANPALLLIFKLTLGFAESGAGGFERLIALR